ncbi:hypothetical protein JCM11251_007297 [Rhodosporidiobolus azoricus]
MPLPSDKPPPGVPRVPPSFLVLPLNVQRQADPAEVLSGKRPYRRELTDWDTLGPPIWPDDLLPLEHPSSQSQLADAKPDGQNEGHATVPDPSSGPNKDTKADSVEDETGTSPFRFPSKVQMAIALPAEDDPTSRDYEGNETEATQSMGKERAERN